VADLSNIRSIAADVYVGYPSSDAENLSEWTEVGWIQEGTTSLTVSNKRIIKLSRRLYHISSDYLLKFSALETDLAKVSTLESYRNINVDLLLVNRSNNFKKHRYKRFIMTITPKYEYGLSNVFLAEVELQRSAVKISDFFEEIAPAIGNTHVLPGVVIA
jgi:hypothetical protein